MQWNGCTLKPHHDACRMLLLVLQEYANHDGVLLKVYVLGQDTIRVSTCTREASTNASLTPPQRLTVINIIH